MGQELQLTSQPETSSLNELFERDPVKITDDEVDQLCKVLREKRRLWLSEEVKAKAQGKRPKVKVTLGELDI